MMAVGLGPRQGADEEARAEVEVRYLVFPNPGILSRHEASQARELW
jgi:hypothetical protein